MELWINTTKYLLNKKITYMEINSDSESLSCLIEFEDGSGCELNEKDFHSEKIDF